MSSLDDAGLMRSLVRQAKSSHSSQGRAMDVALSHRSHVPVSDLAPSALTSRRREQEQQLQREKQLSAAWGASMASRSRGVEYYKSMNATAPTAHAAVAAAAVHGDDGAGMLQAPVLATITPSFTKAADEGVEAYGGTMVQGPGFASVVGMVPTAETVQCIEDNYELISSMRPYQYDHARQGREAALRDAEAPPHPDLLRQLEPALASVRPAHLIDIQSLPLSFLPQRPATADDDDADARPTSGAHDAADDAPDPHHRDEDETSVAARHRRGGTYPFVCKGRPTAADECRRLPGQRQPPMGHYHPRFSVIEKRTVGGYIAPEASAVVRRGRPAGDTASETTDAASRGGDPLGATGGANTDFSQTHGATMTATAHARADATGTMGDASGADNTGGDANGSQQQQQLQQPEGGAQGDSAAGPHHRLRPGENIKGSSMFLSKTERKMERGTAAPDVDYWPYPDARSTTRRVPCGVQLTVPQNRRRRDPPVSGVPAAMYKVEADIAANPHRVVEMQWTTGRQSHWYGRTGDEQRFLAEDGRQQPRSTDDANIDTALRVTQPRPKVATLPPREAPPPDDKLRQHLRAKQQGQTVSVEMNLSYPPPLTGGPDSLAKVRDFRHVPGRSQCRSAKAARAAEVVGGHVPGPYDDGTHTVADAYALTERRAAAPTIHPRAPGHAPPFRTATHTEFGPVPDLKWTKPNKDRTSRFGVSGSRGDAALPIHDLAYDVERGYPLVEPRVTGNPAIGSVITRQKREKIFSKQGCGPRHILSYDGVDKADKAKSVPLFEKQVTKETQFVGHSIPSERWERKNPKAPGPGYYNVSYKAVE